MTSGSLLGFSLYGLVVVTITLVALFTKGWTKSVIVGLIVLWVPLLLWGVAFILLAASAYGHFFLAWLIIAGPIVLILVVFLVVWKLLTRFRD
jgi:general stress protein CsbA